jgi:hypothetical protein
MLMDAAMAWAGVPIYRPLDPRSTSEGEFLEMQTSEPDAVSRES